MTAILLLLGLTSNTLLQDNFKMKKTNSISKKNFYVAEALSEEAHMKLNEHLKLSLYNSYEIILEYMIRHDNHDMDVKVINRMFKSTFKDQLELSKVELENKNSYNLKIIENYDIALVIVLEENPDQEEFYLEILSVYADKKLVEKIETKYIIKFPEYSDFKHNSDLIDKVNWVNYKW